MDKIISKLAEGDPCYFAILCSIIIAYFIVVAMQKHQQKMEVQKTEQFAMMLKKDKKDE